MKKEDINYELISKLEIKVEDTQFYLPGETIKGKILLNPQYKIKEEILHLTIKIMQYEFWDYVTKGIEELKNIYTTVIQEENIEYKLEKEELPKKESVEGFENCSIIMKEDENKVISIPFEIVLDNEKILPTFQFENEEYFLGIRHLILVECKEYNSSNYTGLFIGKNKNIEMSDPKEIKESYMVGLGSLEVIAYFPKLSISPGEDLKVEITTKSNLHFFKKVSKITQTFYRNIKWVGYMKNTLLDKKIYSDKSSDVFQKKMYNNYIENKFEMEFHEAIIAPISPILFSAGGLLAGGVVGFLSCMGIGDPFAIFSYDDNGYDDGSGPANIPLGIVVGILGVPVGAIGGFFYGLYEQGRLLVNGFRYIKNGISNGINYSLNNKKASRDVISDKITEKEKMLLIENIKKFVYFNDNKVVGFIKFAQDITPNVNGYYFNCEYNMKIDVDIEGIILNRNKYLKTPIDLYDSDEYITHMKNSFKN